ncbi:MAG TPA: class I SAM-dependent methyltransferase [Longimicrobiaceae bacterium]
MRSIDYDASGVATAYTRGRVLPAETVAGWMALLASEIPASRVAAVLDLGCGAGRFSQALADAFGAAVAGVDPSPAMLAEARAVCGNRVHLAAGRGDAIPLRDWTFDVAFLSMIYHHLPDPAACARELARVVRGDGRVFVRNSTRESLDTTPYLRFIPEARTVGREMLPGRAEVVEAFSRGGLALARHQVHRQMVARSWRDYAENLRQRALSDLRRISDEAFERGIAQLAEFARGPAGGEPVHEEIDLFTFRPARAEEP